MDNFSDDIKSILEIEESDKFKFRKIEISSDKTAYLAVRESEKIMFGKLTSLSLEPVALIIKEKDEYRYHGLNDEKFDENIVREFVKECL